MFCKMKRSKADCITKDNKGNEIQRCGILIKMKQTINDPSGGAGRENEFNECAFVSIINMLGRIEQRFVGLQAAIESSRNQKNLDDQEIIKTVAQGMMAMTHAVQEDPKAARFISMLANTVKVANDRQEGTVKKIKGGLKAVGSS